MDTSRIVYKDFKKEFQFSTARSSGPGGQNVNKVNSKVELRINILNSQIFSENEKLILNKILKNSINQKGELIISSQTERTQLLNKQRCIEKFYFIVSNALKPLKIRKKTKPSKTAIVNRIITKKKRSEIKNLRRSPEI